MLQRFPNLLELDLMRCCVDALDDHIMRRIGQLTMLTRLALKGGSSVRVNGFSQLAGLTRLKSLKLRSCYNLDSTSLQLVASGVGHNLTELDLTGATELEDDGLLTLIPLIPRVQTLTLHLCSALSAVSLREITRLRDLNTLNLENMACMTDACLARCGPLPGVTRLDLGHNVNLRTLCYTAPTSQRPTVALSPSTAAGSGISPVMAMVPVVPLRHLPRVRTKPRRSGVVVRAHGGSETLEFASDDDDALFFISDHSPPVYPAVAQPSIFGTPRSVRESSPVALLFARSPHALAAPSSGVGHDAPSARPIQLPRWTNSPAEGANGGGSAGMTDLAVRWPALAQLSLRGNAALEDSALLSVSVMASLTSLDVDHCDSLTDGGLIHVLRMTNLKALSMHSCTGITGSAFAKVPAAELAPLTLIVLSRCPQIWNARLQSLSQLRHLESLSVHGCEGVGDIGLQCVTALSKLTHLDISKCASATSQMMQHIGRLHALRSLDLSATSIKASSLEHILSLTLLTQLNIAGLRDVGDTTVVQLKALHNLRYLNIGCTQVSADGIRGLEDMPFLSIINYYNCTQIPPTGTNPMMRKLQRACAQHAMQSHDLVPSFAVSAADSDANRLKMQRIDSLVSASTPA